MAKKKEEGMDTLQHLALILTRMLEIFEEDRKIALSNYQDLKEQLQAIKDKGYESSENAVVEREVNKAVQLVMTSSAKLESVIDSISKILSTQINAESRERAAAHFAGKGSGQLLTSAVDLKQLMNSQMREEEEE